MAVLYFDLVCLHHTKKAHSQTHIPSFTRTSIQIQSTGGLMGNGITQVTAAAGYNVTMVSQGEERECALFCDVLFCVSVDVRQEILDVVCVSR